MKSTKIMLAIIACLLTTWTSISLIGWMLSDASLRECFTNDGIIMLMIFIGWLPALIIGIDLDKQIED